MHTSNNYYTLALCNCIIHDSGALSCAEIPLYGSTGIGDVAPLSHLILSLFGEEFKPVRGETLPLIAQNSVSTAQASLAVYDLKTLLDQLVVLASLDIEAFQANPSPYDLVLSQFRRFPGYQSFLRDLRFFACFFRVTSDGTPLVSWDRTELAPAARSVLD